MLSVVPQLPKIFPGTARQVLPWRQGLTGMVETTIHLPNHVPTVAEVEAIAELPDPVQRNLRITLAYHDLNHALAARLGYQNGNWCAFSTWASKTAGSFIRGERSFLSVQAYLEQAGYVKQTLARLNQVLAWSGVQNQTISLKPAFLAAIIDQIIDGVATQIGRGNQLVFASIAPLFARFLETFADSTTYDEAELTQFFNNHFIPGPLGDGGQDMLMAAFRHYYEALFVTEAKARAELVLLANLYVGYHEQTRLQEAITGAMNTPLELKLATAPVDAAHRWLQANLPMPAAGLIWLIWQKPLRRLAQRIAADWRTIMTRWFMTIKLPTETLWLGQDVSLLETGKMFPEELRELKHPALLALLQELDGTLDSSRGSAANDWGCLRDRMNFLVDLFRSRQQSGRLYQQPFGDAQVAVIRAGGIPDGPL
jgi:hypothetical protein